jgi:uncharacterized membrane protein
MNDIGVIAAIIFIMAVVFIIGGLIWFLATIAPIPAWGWLVILGIAVLTVLYIAAKVFGEQ